MSIGDIFKELDLVSKCEEIGMKLPEINGTKIIVINTEKSKAQ